MTSILTAAAPPLTLSARIQNRLQQGLLSRSQVDDFQSFLYQVEHDFLQHPIITQNAYTQWFQQGAATDDELRYFIQQFSVFSNQFLVAALLKVINSPTLQQSRASREILLNELGVIYRKLDGTTTAPSAETEEDKDREGDPEVVSTEGTVDGGICRFRAAHFEWLIAVAEGLGLHYENLGQRKHGSRTTLHFCDELQRLYGSEAPNIAEGASFAVENWAAAGFWQELEDGLLQIKRTRHPHLRLAFFTWHNRVEAQHAGHTLEELEAVYFKSTFDRTQFIQGGKAILDAIAVFWNGLEHDRMNHVYV